MQLEADADFRRFEEITSQAKIMSLSQADQALVRRYIGRNAAAGSLAAYVLEKIHSDDLAMEMRDALEALYRREGDDG